MKSMNISMRAIWIIDEEYIVPAFLSICSFLDVTEVPVTLVYCGESGLYEFKNLFTSLHKNLSFETFQSPAEFQHDARVRTITNRLARMHYAQKYQDEIVLLLDADILFAQSGAYLIRSIKSSLPKGRSTIFGVLDAKIAYRDYLYFRTQGINGRDMAVPHQMQKDIYADVFGDNWWYHLKGASINNGVVAFYQCAEVVKVWESFYRKGLVHDQVNAGDDQLPLAAAIHRTDQYVHCLPDTFNSKGNISGDYHVYHAFSSIWRMQVVSALRGETGVSDFADRLLYFTERLPANLKQDFLNKHKLLEPYLFRKLKGDFGYQHLYQDISKGITSGTWVEVGLQHGKSACFMLELIKYKKLDVRLVAVPLPDEDFTKLTNFKDTTRRFGLDQHLEIKKQTELKDYWSDQEKVDFVFLNVANDYDQLFGLLEYWYEKLSPDGILAGYDYTSQIGLHFGDACATYDFCQLHSLSLRISFDIFLIERSDLRRGTAKSDEFSNVSNFAT